MATLYQRKTRGGKFQLNYTDIDGRRYQIDTGTADPQVADLWLKRVEDLLSQARLGIRPKLGRLDADTIEGKEPKKTSITLADYKERYEKRCKEDLELAPKTIEANNNAINALIAAIGNKSIDEVTDEDIVSWKTHMLKKGYARTTVGIYFRHLKAAFSRATKWELIPTNPFDKVESVKQSTDRRKKANKAMSNEEVRILLNAIDEAKDYDFGNYVRFLLYTGCRRTEVLNLRWEDIDLKRKQMKIYAEKTKRDLELPINSSLMEVIEDMEKKQKGFVFQSKSKRRGAYKKDQPWHKDFVSHHFKDYIDALELPKHYTLHSLRHTFTNRLLEQGVPREFVHKLLGHSSERTTAEHYDHTIALHFRDQVELAKFDG